MSDTTERVVVGPDRRFLDAARALYVDGVTAEVVTAVQAAGIPTIVLKGPSIARWLYPTGGRTYGDTDLLVPPPRFADAKSVLRSMGFREKFEGFHPIEPMAGPAEAPFIRGGGLGTPRGAAVDLHRSLPGMPTPAQAVWDALSDGSETMRVGGIDVTVLDRIGRALHVVLHAVQHGFLFHTDDDLRRVIDALPTEDWRAVRALAERLGVEDLLAQGLNRTTAGAEIADRLGFRRLTADLTSPYTVPRGAPTLSRLCAAPTVREKMTVVRWALVPSPARAREVTRRRGPPPRSLIAAYGRYWENAARSLLPAVHFTVRAGVNAARHPSGVDGASRRPHDPACGRPRRGGLRGGGPMTNGRATPVARYSPGSPVSCSDWLLLLEAALCLGVARLSVLTLPFRWVTGALRQQLGESPVDDDSVSRRQRQRVAWSLHAVSRRAPWDTTCLSQALAGKYMLRRRRVASTLYLGVAKDDDASLAAHAWLRSGGVVLTGGRSLERFSVIAAFRD